MESPNSDELAAWGDFFHTISRDPLVLGAAFFFLIALMGWQFFGRSHELYRVFAFLVMIFSGGTVFYVAVSTGAPLVGPDVQEPAVVPPLVPPILNGELENQQLSIPNDEASEPTPLRRLPVSFRVLVMDASESGTAGAYVKRRITEEFGVPSQNVELQEDWNNKWGMEFSKIFYISGHHPSIDTKSVAEMLSLNFPEPRFVIDYRNQPDPSGWPDCALIRCVMVGFNTSRDLIIFAADDVFGRL